MKNNSLVKAGMFVIIISGLLAFIVVAKNILFPLVLAMFFAYLIYPVVWKVEKWGVHRGIAIFLVLLLLILVLGGVMVPLSIKLTNASIGFKEIMEQFDAKSDSVQNLLQEKFGIRGSKMDQYLQKAWVNIGNSLQKELGDFFSATTTVIFQIAILPVFIFFFLFYRTKTAYFIFKIVGRKNKALTLKILREISTLTTKYLGGVMIVVAILAILISLGLLIIGINHAIAMGILAALLNLIPYFGTLLGGLIPIMYVYFTESSPLESMLKIVGMFIIVQFIENNLLTPNIVGNSIKMNPFTIIVSLLLANLIWGVAGMVVVVPLLAILKVIMRNIDGLEPFAYLISDRGMEEYGIWDKLLGKIKNLYK
jgi:predicted PurR-regulated permease PerM